MLTHVDAISSQGSLLSLPLEDLETGLMLDSIEGLDPVKATIVTTSFAGQDGGEYQSSRREERDLKLKISLEPDYALEETVRQLRKRLYKTFMPKAAVQLTFHTTDENPWIINGRVEDFNNDQFSSEPTVDIDIRCSNPDFIDPIPVKVSGNSVSNTNEFLVPYDGTVESGMKFVIKPNRNLAAFTIYHRAPDGMSRSMDFAGALINGDTLTITTSHGAKGAVLKRSTTESSLLWGIDPRSTWFELQNGDNYFRVFATGAAIPFDMEFINRYGGL